MRTPTQEEIDGHFEPYSHRDAVKRHPEAWHLCRDQWGREWYERNAGVEGLGYFVQRGKTWFYFAPDGRVTPLHDNYGKPEPPPLPRPNPSRCGCGKFYGREHRCGACGTPFWHEFHGVADGACSYCYYSG